MVRHKTKLTLVPLIWVKMGGRVVVVSEKKWHIFLYVVYF